MKVEGRLKIKVQDNYTQISAGSRFEIYKKEKEYFIITYEKGIPLSEINEHISNHGIEITNFINLRNAVTSKFNELLPFGQEKDKILITISMDSMKAYVNFDLSENELVDKFKVKEKVKQLLAKEGVVFGINIDVLDSYEQIPGLVNILIAEGTEPVRGEDSVVKVIDIKEVKPKELDDGSVDYHDMGIINLVKSGDWLGEWTLPTDGIPGTNVNGITVLPVPGKLKTISYDKKTVKEVEDEGKVTLCSLKNGAVAFEGTGAITVSNHMVIDNVNFNTGNIDFDGFVTIKGTVADNFSVVATEDIEIKGPEGIGGVTEIISKKGNVLIAGGINGRGKAVIKGFTIASKFISNATVVAQNKLVVGRYIMHSNIDSKEVILEGRNTHIAGGQINNVTKILVDTIGNATETRTIINLSEINREEMSKKLQELTDKIESNKTTIFKIEKVLLDNQIQPEKISGLISQKAELQDANSYLEKQFHELKRFLTIKGDAQVTVLGSVLPGVRIMAGEDELIFDEKAPVSCVYSINGKLQVE